MVTLEQILRRQDVGNHILTLHDSGVIRAVDLSHRKCVPRPAAEADEREALLAYQIVTAIVGEAPVVAALPIVSKA